MLVTIHQPEFLPWLGFFDKMDMADLFVLLDNVQYCHGYFQNRNRIRGARSGIWVTIPVLHSHCENRVISAMQIDNSKNWKRKIICSIECCYSRSPFFDDYFKGLIRCFESRSSYLKDLNVCLIQYIAESFGINKKIILASDLEVGGKGSQLIRDICLKTGADIYLSGVSGSDYLDAGDFEDHGIELRYQQFFHPIYRQVYEPFIPCMSAIDLLFNYGESSLDIIRDPDGVRMETLFR